MKTLIVHRRTLWTRWLEALAEVVPTVLIRAIAGPSTRHVAGAAPPGAILSLRPLEVVVPHDLFLTRRLRISRKGLPDLRHAIDLLVRRETPFVPSELLVHAQEEEAPEAGPGMSFMVRMIPIATLRRVLVSARLPLRLVTDLRVEEAGRVLPHLNLVAALRPSLRLRWLTLAIPIATIVVATTLLSQQHIAERSSLLAAMEQSLSARTLQLELLSRQIEDEKARGTGLQAVTDLLAETASAYDSLRWLRAALPQITEVSLVELARGEMKVSVRSPNVLADLEHLNTADHGWSVSIQGALTTDPSTGLELATLLHTRELQ